MNYFEPTAKYVTIDCFNLELYMKLCESKAKTLVNLNNLSHLLNLKITITKQQCKMI
jgi:hypothetical protein